MAASLRGSRGGGGGANGSETLLLPGSRGSDAGGTVVFDSTFEHPSCGWYSNLDSPLPSMVPDGELLGRAPSESVSRGGRKALVGVQSSLELAVLSAAAEDLLMLVDGRDVPGLDAAATATAATAAAMSLRSLPSCSSPRTRKPPFPPNSTACSSVHGRSLRASSAASLPPQQFQESDCAPPVATAAPKTGLASPDSMGILSYKSQVQRPSKVVSLLTDGDGCGGAGEVHDGEDLELPVWANGLSPVDGVGGRPPGSLFLSEQHANGGDSAVQNVTTSRRGGTQAWVSGSAPGELVGGVWVRRETNRIMSVYV